MDDDLRSIQGVRDLIRNSKEALQALSAWSQQDIDRLVRTVVETCQPKAEYLAKLAVDGIVGYSVVPLRAAFVAGIILALFSFLLFLHVLYAYVCDEAVSGWTTIMVCLSLFGGTQLIMLGVMGEYLGRIYTEVKNRPLYLLKNDGNEEKSHV